MKRILFLIFFSIICIICLGLIVKFSIIRNNKNLIYVAGIVNHHLLAKDIIDKFFKEASKFQYNNIVILSPDHFNQCSIYGKSFIFKEDSQAAINNDHGIQNLLPIVRKTWPKANIIPILVCNKGGELPINILKDESTFFIASVDFSHYLPERLMNLHDSKSISNITNFEDDSNIDVDCPRCVKIVKDFAISKEATNILEVGKNNSFAYSKSNNPKDGTSYYSVIFSKSKINFKVSKVKTFLFVGDIMLDRGVREKIDKNGFSYLLKNIKESFKGVDYIVGNLEGPIVKDAPKNSKDSMIFAFNDDVINFLKQYKFNVLSLANNHTNNYNGKIGYDSTVSLLKENNINPFGHYGSCEMNYGYRDGNNYFIGFNLVNGDNGCSELVLKTIETIKKENKNSFVVLYPHWGEEYKLTSNSFQQRLAHQFVDAGADLIIGSHPHVVQEIELYKDKLIFYSLGNFIFDQYFSKDTQQGLIVGCDGYDYFLIPVKEKQSAVNFMNNDDGKNFLEGLAEKSSYDLTSMIKNGKIELIKH